METIKKAIPNTLTCLNLFSGCIACFTALCGDFDITLIFIILSAIFDFCDGLMARALNVSSPIGKELDSLADDISFGLVPAMIAFSLLRKEPLEGCMAAIPYLAFLIAVFSALRLAKFNLDTRQTHSFIGLPTPANTLFWISLAMGIKYINALSNISGGMIIAIIIISSALLVSEIPMFSLKFANLSWRENKVRFIFLIGCIPLFFLGWLSLAVIILWYIVLSLINNVISSLNKS
jgi:CDP-diacylglycerol--serine O-phosphatidyltransferase